MLTSGWPEKLEDHDVLSGAMGRGEVNVDEARAIVAALAMLRKTGEFAVTTEQRTRAERHLVGLAAHHDAKELRFLGGKIMEVIAPELAEKFEGQALEREEPPGACSAPTTTDASTTPATRPPAYRTTRSPSTDASEPKVRPQKSPGDSFMFPTGAAA